MRKLLTTASVFTLAFLFLAASNVAAHSCQNTKKQEEAGTQAIENNGGVAGFTDESPTGEEVFIHPSVSQTPIPLSGAPGQFKGYEKDEESHMGSLPSGAHDSEAWTEVSPPGS